MKKLSIITLLLLLIISCTNKKYHTTNTNQRVNIYVTNKSKNIKLKNTKNLYVNNQDNIFKNTEHLYKIFGEN